MCSKNGEQIMLNASSRLDAPPVSAAISFSDVVDWLREGDYVILYNSREKCGRFFHECQADTKSFKQISEFLHGHKVIYLDVTSRPGVLSKGHWEWHLREAGYDRCTCSLKQRVSRSKGIPHPFYLKLQAKDVS
jgi:hypothetical protein